MTERDRDAELERQGWLAAGVLAVLTALVMVIGGAFLWWAWRAHSAGVRDPEVWRFVQDPLLELSNTLTAVMVTPLGWAVFLLLCLVLVWLYARCEAAAELVAELNRQDSENR